MSNKKSIKVTSHGQSGGLTGGIINVANTGHRRQRKIGFWGWIERWGWIAAIIGAIPIVLGGIWYLFHHMNSNSNSGTVNVTSFNQSGGITAHTVNLSEKPWEIGEKAEQFASLLKSAPRGPVEIDVLFNDPNAAKFGEELATRLRDIGYDVSGPIYCAVAPFKGLAVEVRQADRPSPAGYLQHALRALGLPTNGQLNADLPDGSTKVWVGSK